jgi:hypothetical protein
MSMPEETIQLRNRGLETPRAAAVAGIIFAVLMGASYAIFQVILPTDLTADPDWLKTQAGIMSLALGLVPFAGIAFIWFMGVARERVGMLEDQFFSTIFTGSGLLYLAMTFGAAAIGAALLMIYRVDPELLSDGLIVIVLRAVIFQFNRVFAMRMAGVHMIVSGTIWLQTEVIPRWLALVTFLLALLFIFGVALVPWLTILFPAWVFLISVYILYWNFLMKKNISEEGHSGTQEV